MPTEHWCKITQNTAPRLASSPRQNSHMQCQPHGRVYNVISPTTPEFIAVWNKEAQQHITDASPNWLQTLQRSIPEAVWGKNQYLAREDTDHITNHVCPQYLKSKKEDVTGQERGRNVNLQPWDDKQFELKCLNWKFWAYTDGSCIGKAENFLGTGVYCPQTKLNVMWTQEAWE